MIYEFILKLQRASTARAPANQNQQATVPLAGTAAEAPTTHDQPIGSMSLMIRRVLFIR